MDKPQYETEYLVIWKIPEEEELDIRHSSTVERCKVSFHLFLSFFPMLIEHINYLKRKWNEAKKGYTGLLQFVIHK